jgi:hypothetical protein
MNYYKHKGYTLIDITKTGILTREPLKQRNQQRNWETIQQILSFRAQPMEMSYIGSVEEDLETYCFGANYQGIHRIWTFEFAIERDDVYRMDHDRYGSLKHDLSLIPVILGLDETIKPSTPMLYSSGLEKNIYFIAQR